MKLFRRDDYQWHRVFAWRPVRVSLTEVRWLETVERRRVEPPSNLEFEYRAIPDEGVMGVCLLQDPPAVRGWINAGQPITVEAGAGYLPPPPKR
jgi:hypothetical protein